MKVAATVTEEHGDGAVIHGVGACVGDDEVGVVVVIAVGDSDPARAGAGGDGYLAEAWRLRVGRGTEGSEDDEKGRTHVGTLETHKEGSGWGADAPIAECGFLQSAACRDR